MTYLFTPVFWLQMVYFWVCIFFAFYIPGNVLLKKQKLHVLTNVVLSFGVGMILWGFQGLVFGYLHIRWVSYIYLGIFLTLWIKNSYPFRIASPFKKIVWKEKILPIFLILLGSLIQLSAVWFNGIPTNKGDYYCCGDARDNILHIAIAKSFIQNVPPLEPGLSNVVIKNYHYFSSVIVGELVRVFRLPLIATDYQFMTIFISLFLGFSLIVFGKVLSLSPPLVNWMLFFFYFGGDLVFGLVLVMTHKLSFAMSSLEDGSKFLANYPRAFGIDALIVGIILLSLFLKDRKNKLLGILLALVLGSVVSQKVYVGIFAIVGIFAVSLFQFLKKNFTLIPYAFLALTISLSLYLPVNAGAGGLYFTGFWLFENYITQSGFHLIRWELARTIYQQHHSYLRVLSYELLYIVVYIITIFGTKILGFFQTKKSLQQFPIELHIFLLSGLFVSFVAGSFFQQSAGSGANSFNFLVSIFIIGSFYTALAVWYWLQKFPKKIAIIIASFIIGLTIIRVSSELYKNLDRMIHFKGVLIPTAQLQAFKFINTHLPNNTVLLVDQNSSFGFDREISYVYLYTNQQMYLSGQIDELDSHSVSYKARNKVVEDVRGNNRCSNAYLLFHSPIQYILTDDKPFFVSSGSAKFLTQEYRNDSVSLYKVNKNAVSNFLQTVGSDTNCTE